jgi:uncharacterized protein YegP (UPF0339 family)
MKSYISIICASSILVFSSCAKNLIEPTTLPVTDNPIEPSFPTTPTITSVKSSSQRVATLQSVTSSSLLGNETDIPTTTTITDAGIKGAKVGDPLKKMEEIYGSAFENYKAIDGAYQHYLWFFNKGIIASSEPNKSTTIEADTKIKSIELFGPFEGKTAKNIGIGSTKADVLGAYGKPSSSNALDGDKYDTMYIRYNSETEAVESIIIKY